MKPLVLYLLRSSQLRLTRHLDRRARRMGIRKDQDPKMVRLSIASAAITTLSKTAVRSNRRITAHTKPLVEGVEGAGATGWGEMVDQLLVALLLLLLLGFLSHPAPVGSQLCLLGSLDLTRMTPWLP